MNRSKRQPRLVSILLILSSFILCNAAHARDYLIEIVLFENLENRQTTASGLYYPKLEKSIRLNTEAAAAAGFRAIETGLSLNDNAASIAASRGFKLLEHMAWRQPGLDEKQAIAVRINVGKNKKVFIPDDLGDFDAFIPASANQTPTHARAINTTQLSGTIEIQLGRFLHMNALLVFTDAETQQSFRLNQHRKMRSRELHYIDNPRFGILTRILPIEDPEGSTGSQ